MVRTSSINGQSVDTSLAVSHRYLSLFDRYHVRRRANAQSESEPGPESDSESNPNKASGRTESTQPTPSSSNHPGPPSYPQAQAQALHHFPNYYPYYTLNHPPYPQSSHQHPHPQ